MPACIILCKQTMLFKRFSPKTLVSQLFPILGQTAIPFAFVANLDDFSTFSTNIYLRPSKAMS